MKRSRFTEQQIAFALHQAETGTSVAEIIRKLGITEQTFFRWKKKYGKLMPSQVRKFKQLEEENSRLRRLVAEFILGQGDVAGGDPKKALRPAQRREAVDVLMTCYQVSTRRACQVLRAPRSTLYYRPRKDEQAFLRKRIKEIAATRTRYGYKRIHTVLQREGWKVNHKRIYRLYCEEGLKIRHKRPKRRVSAKVRDDRTQAIRPNQCWSMDFMADQLIDGRRIRVLTIVDNFSRVSPLIGVDFRYKGCVMWLRL